MAENNEYKPIFTCEEDFERIWRKDPMIKSKCFSDFHNEIIADSFVYKSFRNEYETDNLFNKNNIEKIKNGELNFDDLPVVGKNNGDFGIPGYKPEAFIPENSSLNKDEMRNCFHMYVDMCKNKTLTTERLALYNKYNSKIQEEQNRYQEMAREAWYRENKERMNEIEPVVLKHINHLWKERLQRVYYYPKQYIKVSDIGLSKTNEDVSSKMIHSKLAKHVGSIPRYIIPNCREYPLNIFKPVAEVNDFGKHKLKDSYKKIHNILHKMNYHPDVSKDLAAESLAIDNEVDIVISASGWLCLVDNHSENIPNTWNLPIIIKEHTVGKEKKKIIYIDKPLPKKSLTASDRIKWFSKIQLSKLLMSMKDFQKPNSTHNVPSLGTTFDISSLETFGVDFGPGKKPNYTKKKTNADSTLDFSAPEIDIKTSKLDIDKKQSGVGEDNVRPAVDAEAEHGLILSSDDDKLIIDTTQLDENNDKSDTEKMTPPPISSFKKTPIYQRNLRMKERIAYNIWSLTSEKTNLKKLKLLIRSKSGGKGKIRNDYLKVSPKLEYQTEFGAEVVTVSEALRDWGNIIIRPGYKLMRVRLDALTGDLIMLEGKLIQELTEEVNRLYGFNPYCRLTAIRILLGNILDHEPGCYILSHSPENGNFAELYREETKKSTFNLSLSYQTVNTEAVLPTKIDWSQIDQHVITPYFHFFNRIPAMFHPKRTIPFISKLEGGKSCGPKKPVKKKPVGRRKKLKCLKPKQLAKKSVSESD